MTTAIAKTGFRLIAGGAFALLVAAGGGAAFAHGGNHSRDGGHGRCIDCGGPGGLGPVHGPGSSHNPIIYHPVHGPGSSHNPIVAPVVRDHRRPSPRHRSNYDPHCNHRNFTGCPEVRDHRTPPLSFQSIFNFF